MVLPEVIFPEIAAVRKLPARKIIAVVGGGPAGLMAAEVASSLGHAVTLFDSMPSVGRKFLMAGRGGLNITHSDPPQVFHDRFGAASTGSSGRVFPTDFKAAPLLRAWMRRLRGQGIAFRVRHRWVGWNQSHDLCFQSPDGPRTFAPDATILSLGGGSWPRLGSDGQWLSILQSRGIACAPLKPSNCGFDMDWSDHLRTRFAGTPLKSVVLKCREHAVKGDVVLTETGLEGGPVYALSALLRDTIGAEGAASLFLDLCPDRTVERLAEILAAPRGSRSLSAHLKRTAGLPAPALALLHERGGTALPQSPAALAALIKALPLTALRPRPLAEAISSAGGIRWDDVDEDLQIRSMPGLFVAGEMLDWEAPTGGYLLTGCLSTGHAAGMGAAAWEQSP